MSVIDPFVAGNPSGNSLWTKWIFLSLVSFFAFDHITKIKIPQKGMRKQLEVIEGKRLLIDTDVLDPEEAD